MTKRESKTRSLWVRRLRRFLPHYLRNHAILREFHGRADVVLHGSTSLGVDDPASDIDLWFLLGDDALAKLDDSSETRFFEFELCGKPAHLNAESSRDFLRRVERCDMPLISELRNAVVVLRNHSAGRTLIRRARKPMKPAVRTAFFFHHYVEMRGFHKSCRGPMARKDGFAVLLGLAQTLSHALQAAMVLDGEPYPYEKWLRAAASRTRTGRKLAPMVDRLLDVLAAGGLRSAGPDAENPVNQELWTIRETLIRAARKVRIREPWLDTWWFHMTRARDAVRNIRW